MDPPAMNVEVTPPTTCHRCGGELYLTAKVPHPTLPGTRTLSLCPRCDAHAPHAQGLLAFFAIHSRVSVSARSERSEPRSANTDDSVSARSERSEPRSANTDDSVSTRSEHRQYTGNSVQTQPELLTLAAEWIAAMQGEPTGASAAQLAHDADELRRHGDLT
jgi:hypothetical protein